MKTTLKDQGLQEQLEDLYKKQNGQANSVDFQNDPGDLQGVYKISTEIMDRNTFRTFSNRKHLIGSWIAGQSIPRQLLTQRHLTIDLTVDALKEERPYGLPVDALAELIANGFLFCNIRDFDSQREKGFPDLCTGKAGENLRKLLDSSSNQFYIGSALRQPLFDAGFKWQGKGSQTLESVRSDAIRYLADSEKAFISERKVNPELNKISIFRKESPKLEILSWHWAFLNALKSKLDLIFFDNKIRLGLDSKYENAHALGKAWAKSKTPENQLMAAKAFVDLSIDLRTFHQMYTAPITASWGTCYNFTAGEHYKVVGRSAEVTQSYDLTKDVSFQQFMLYVFGKELNLRDSVIDAVAKDQIDQNELDSTTFDIGRIRKLMETILHENSRIDAIQKKARELNDYYFSTESLSESKSFDIIRDFDELRNGFAFHVLDKLSLKPTEFSLNKILSALEINISFLKLDLKVKLSDVLERCLLPKKQDRILYSIHRIIS
jgi:hypothetical protein